MNRSSSLDAMMGDEEMKAASSMPSLNTFAGTDQISADGSSFGHCQPSTAQLELEAGVLRKSVSFVEGMVTDVALTRPPDSEEQKRAMHYTEEELEHFRFEFIRLKAKWSKKRNAKLEARSRGAGVSPQLRLAVVACFALAVASIKFYSKLQV
jgi:hypothetical protein